MEWALAEAPTAVDVLTVPTDTPFVPLDLVDRLIGARDAAGTEMAFALSAGRLHPVVGLWPVRLAPLLRHALIHENIRRADRWTARFNLVHVPFAVDPIDPFFNINTREDLAEAEKWITTP
jgi:molybdopterin-guanine dinucleotide biosynthesis protein A